MDTTAKELVTVIDTETTGVNPHTAKLLGYSIKADAVAEYKAVTQAPDGRSVLFLQSLRRKDHVVAHNGKYDKIVLTKEGYPFYVWFDTMIAYYLLRINQSRKLETIVQDVFQFTKEDLQQVYNRVTQKDRKSLPEKWWKEIPETALAEYAAADAHWTYKIFEYCNQQLTGGLRDWFFNIEMPLVNILAEMELNGVLVDWHKLAKLSLCLTRRLFIIKDHLEHISQKQELNLNSPKQLQDVLYNQLRLPKYKKTKTGVSTDSKTLVRLAKLHAFPALLIEYRELEKLVSTYTTPILQQLDVNARLHTTYNQALTATRRFSSEHPNLQNIPTKSDWGKKVRECFIPQPEHAFFDLDYDQIELRLLAHFSEEPKLITAFANAEDIHQLTASLIGGKLGRELPRETGKTLNFSLLYGKTAYGFAQDWNCSQQEAQSIIDLYFEQFPKVLDWMESQKALAIQTGGWLKTLAGLPLYIGDVFSNNTAERAHILRCAVNYPIQGSSQDILKQAIVFIYNKLRLVPVLMVHDELVYEISNNLLGDLSTINSIVNLMENCVKLKVPVKVSHKISERWEK